MRNLPPLRVEKPSVTIVLGFGLALIAGATAFYGWIVMLVAGALGWHIGFLPAAGLGFLLSGLTTRVSKS